MKRTRLLPLPLPVGAVACALLALAVVLSALALRGELADRQRNRASYLDAHQQAYDATAATNRQVVAAARDYLDRDLRGADELLATTTEGHRALKTVQVPVAQGFEEEGERLAELVREEDRFLQALSRLVRRDPMDTPSAAGDAVRGRWSDTAALLGESSEDVGITSPPIEDQADVVDDLVRAVLDRGQERRDLRDRVAAREAELAPRRAALQRYADAVLAVLADHRDLQDELEALDYGAREVRSIDVETGFELVIEDHARRRNALASTLDAITPPTVLAGLHDGLVTDLYDLADIVDDAYPAASEVYCGVDDFEPYDPLLDDPFYDPFYDPTLDPFYVEPEPIECDTIGESPSYTQFLADQLPVQRRYDGRRLEWLAAYETELRSLYAVD